MGASESTESTASSETLFTEKPSQTPSADKQLETPPSQPKETAESKKKRKALKFKTLLEEELLESIYPPPTAQVIKTTCRKPGKPVLHHAQRRIIHAEPIGKEERMVNKADGRKQVHATNKWPNSVHGLVFCKLEDGKTAWGTGTLIGPNVVLTAAHNVCCRETQTSIKPEKVQFIPGMNGQLLPFGSVGLSSYEPSPNYLKTGLEDYALLILEKPIGEETGYFGLSCLEPKEIQEKRVNITGYPGDKVSGKPEFYEMWGMEGKICNVNQDKGHLIYKIDTDHGQSGSGIWYQEGEDYYVCGVHVLGADHQNSGTILTRDIYQQMYPHLQQAKDKELSFKLRQSKTLDLHQRKIDANRLSVLLNYSLGNLTFLNLSENKMWKGGATKILAQNTSWVNLSELNLRWNNIGPEGAKALAKNISWINLSKLDLSQNNIGSEGARALAQNTSWVNLEVLFLSDNNIDAEGAKGLLQNTSWVDLSLLYLADNQIDVEGARALVQNSSWKKLETLFLAGNDIDSEGKKELTQSKWWLKSKPKVYF